jgi:hypothetical protein
LAKNYQISLDSNSFISLPLKKAENEKKKHTAGGTSARTYSDFRNEIFLPVESRSKLLETALLQAYLLAGKFSFPQQAF